MRLTILDNRDSFVWNLVQLAKELGAEVELLEASRTHLEDLVACPMDALLVGPGPGHPRQAQLSVALFRALPKLPILGICLGHQALALAHGASIMGCLELAHGCPIEVLHSHRGLFHELPSPAIAGRYHSLTVSEKSLPGTLEISARSPSGEILALASRLQPHYGVQFHPESILSNCGKQLLQNFFTLAARAEGDSVVRAKGGSHSGQGPPRGRRPSESDR